MVEIGNKLQAVENYFSSFNYLQPNTSNGYLHVYLTYITSTQVSGLYNRDTSSIYLNLSSYGLYLSTISHEYYHAIQNAYNSSLPLYFKESSAEYASFMYLKDTNNYYGIDASMYSDQYNYFVEDTNLLADENKYMYRYFILYHYFGITYCNGNLLATLRSYMYNYSSNNNTDPVGIYSDILAIINNSLDFSDVFKSFIAVCYPGVRMDSTLTDFIMCNGNYENESHPHTLYNSSYYETETLQSYGYKIIPVIGKDFTFGHLYISFENIGSDIEITLVSKDSDLDYFNNTLYTGSDNTLNYVFDDFSSYDCICNNETVTIVAYIILTNTGSTSQNVTIDYSTQYRTHDKAKYYIKNVVSNYYISNTSSNLFQFVKTSNANYKQKFEFFKIYGNVYKAKRIATDNSFLCITAASTSNDSNAYVLADISNSYYELYFDEINDGLYEIRLNYNQNLKLCIIDDNIGSESGNTLTDYGNICFKQSSATNYRRWRLYAI